MRRAYFVVVTLLWAGCSLACAETPEQALRNMIEHDMDGDPSARIGLATERAVVDVAPSRQIERRRVAFELDADALEIASQWQFDKPANRCKPDWCDLMVIFKLLATTVGNGVPSQDRPQAREIEVLAHPMERTVLYRLRKVEGAWKINDLPPPYVNPLTLRRFFERESTASRELPSLGSGSRAEMNHELLMHWRAHELETLKKLSPASPPE